MDKKVVLHIAEQPCMAQKKDKEGADTYEANQELYRKFQSILNKLTPQKFQALAEQALKLEINTEERLSGCIDKVFTMALEEPSFSIAYANLCKVMSPIKVEYVSEDGKTKQTNFRRMLLTKCQREFEKDKKDDESMKTMQKELESADTDEKRATLKEEMEMMLTRTRKRSLGNIRFIGELFKLQMLSETIMHECITRLLKSISDEESLECFVRLITTTGKELDSKEAAKVRIDAYFKRINDIIKKGKVPARVRFMLQDVIELRGNSWVPRVRRDQQLKTIDQRRPEPKKILHQPMNKKVVLHKAENPWKAQKKDREGADTAEVQTQQLYRKFRAILNKLTPQKFQVLAEQALKLEINTEERLSGCIHMIFSKALKEPMYGLAYANLCKVMSPIKVEYVTEEGKLKQTNFRRMLLTKCQREFEKDKKDDESMETMQKELESADTNEKRAALKEEMEIRLIKTRKRSVNNVRFMGELFKLMMLSETIMHECVTRLLKSTTDEESLECFARLIMTAGKELDSKEAAKGRIDAYFKRINDIIKKGKVQSRIRFMLQDVIELRENSWIPRVRQDQQLKTIDQIHREAAIEEAKEKEMVQQHQVIPKGGLGGRGDSRRGSKDDQMTKERDHRRREREKFDQSKLSKLTSTRKVKGNSGQSQWAPTGFIRPAAGWKKAGAPSSDGAKSKVPPRSSTAGHGSKFKTDSHAGGRVPSMPGAIRSHTTSDTEKEYFLHSVNKFTTSENLEPSDSTTQAPSRDMLSRDMAQAIRCSDKRPSVPVPTSEDYILFVQRKVTSTIDELVNNKDYKEAIECVKEIDLPGAMKQAVVEGINHTLEQKAVYRPVTGQLFSRLVQEKVISQHDFTDGLSEVLEMAEDMCIDIPRIWDYLGEMLCPVFAHEHIPMSVFKKSTPSLLESGQASILVAKLLACCLSELKSEEEVKGLWRRCGLQWEDLGVRREDLEEFLDRKKLSFLLASKSPVATRELPQSLLESLHSMLMATDSTTDDVNQWIKKNCASQGYDPALLVTNLTSTVVQASVSGTGNDAVLNLDLFEQRMEVVKTQGHYGVAVLHGLQWSMAKLSHPPNLLHDLFNIVYDLDLVDEQEFYTWRDDDQVMYGKGTAVTSVKPFFDWLKADR